MTDPATEDAANKWMCEYCTYMNYRSSMKCTMCAGLKPLLNEDIYRLSPSQPHSPSNAGSGPSLNYKSNNASLTICRSKTPSPQPHNSPQSTRHTPPMPPSNNASPNRGEPSTRSPPAACTSVTSNWKCPTCTYLNHGIRTATTKCGACKTERYGERRTSEDLHNDMNDQLKALSLAATERMDVVHTSDPDLRAAISHRSPSRTTSPLDSASNLSGSRHHLEAAAARVSPVDSKCHSAGPGKWSCSVSRILRFYAFTNL